MACNIMELSYDSQEELIANACKESIRKFPVLENAKFTVIFRLPIKNLNKSVLRNLKGKYTEESILSKSRNSPCFLSGFVY